VNGDDGVTTLTNNTPTVLSLPWNAFESPPTWPIALGAARSGSWREVPSTFNSDLAIVITISAGHSVLSVPVFPFVHIREPQNVEDCLDGSFEEYFDDSRSNVCHKYYALMSICVLIASHGGDSWSVSDAVSGWSQETMNDACGGFVNSRAVGARYTRLSVPRYVQFAQDTQNPFAMKAFPLVARVDIRAADDPTVVCKRAYNAIEHAYGSQILKPSAIAIIAITFTVLGVVATITLVACQARTLFPLARACCRRLQRQNYVPSASP
jgi:hypothetical protein